MKKCTPAAWQMPANRLPRLCKVTVGLGVPASGITQPAYRLETPKKTRSASDQQESKDTCSLMALCRLIRNEDRDGAQENGIQERQQDSGDSNAADDFCMESNPIKMRIATTGNVPIFFNVPLRE